MKECIFGTNLFVFFESAKENRKNTDAAAEKKDVVLS